MGAYFPLAFDVANLPAGAAVGGIGGAGVGGGRAAVAPTAAGSRRSHDGHGQGGDEDEDVLKHCG